MRANSWSQIGCGSKISHGSGIGCGSRISHRLQSTVGVRMEESGVKGSGCPEGPGFRGGPEVVAF